MVLSVSVMYAQMAELYGNDNEFKLNHHTGNNFAVTIFNDGTYGSTGSPYNNGHYIGSWPANSSRALNYLVDGNIFVGSEVKDINGNTIPIFSENKSANIGGSSGDKRPDGSWRTFLPLAGFSNPNNNKIAMARGSVDADNSWPPFWPDIGDTLNPYGLYSPDKWAGSWNGYFGRDIFNADEESYFVADDYQNDEFSFFPDSTNRNRRGLGLRIYVRGFQWSKAAVQDGIFCLYDIHNIGTTNYDKVVFGYKIGNNVGERNASNQDVGDDEASFSKADDLAYMWDRDDIGGSGITPVGYMGGAFLESPGNSFDGIDNDNDGGSAAGRPSIIYTSNGPITPYYGSGTRITTSMFDRGTLTLTSPQIVLIDYNDPKFPRSAPMTLQSALTAAGKGSNDTIVITYGTKQQKIYNGMPLAEIGDDLIDNNLNGLIDENRGYQDNVTLQWNYLYFEGTLGYLCIDYFNPDSTVNGMKNPLIDEGRNDGVDNDGDWDPVSDDVGGDGIGPNDRAWKSPDVGEGDMRTSPGEPHFDKTDIDESDMMGLTSFLLYVWENTVGSQQADDAWLWNNLKPGYFSASLSGNIELLYGSGYFPLPPGQLERLSMAIICGFDYNHLLRNKGYFAEAYGQNYNFAKAPYIPTVWAEAGDNKVTLYWDSLAEYSDDPITGFDFEGYKIYRSTDPAFSDAKPITNAYGAVIFQEPIAQFDSANGISGLAPIPTQGVQFNLGTNTGLRHYWVDTTAKNGYTYYYAVTSYDRGDPVRGLDPSECTKYISVRSDGSIVKGKNVVIVKPEAPAAGYVAPRIRDSKIASLPTNTASGVVDYEIVKPMLLRNSHTYQITFKDTITGSGASRTKSTASYSLVDITAQDTIVVNRPLTSSSDEQLDLVSKTGFKLFFTGNPSSFALNAENSGWSRPNVPGLSLQIYDNNSEFITGDFKVVIHNDRLDTSYYFRTGTTVIPATPVNFSVFNTRTGNKVPFAFRERDTVYSDSINGSKKGIFSVGRNGTAVQQDEIILLAKADSPWVPSWWIRLTRVTTGLSASQLDSAARATYLKPGDSLMIRLNYPFLAHDTLRFTTDTAKIDIDLAKNSLNNIKVVPNPYIVSNAWEPPNRFSSGRGERRLHFTHLPTKCTIRIFNVRGRLVQTLEHNSTSTDGTYVWNMLSRDNLEISYGIYIYQIDAPGIGTKTGKFVVIK